LTSSEIKDVLELDKIEGRHWSLCPCSAFTGDGLLEGIDWVVNDIKSRIFMME
jgi:ADP-ribosylation factor-like protein 2